jgi:hypothetical protein
MGDATFELPTIEPLLFILKLTFMIDEHGNEGRARRVDPDPDPTGSKNFGYDELQLEVKFHYNLMIMKIIIKIT